MVSETLGAIPVPTVSLSNWVMRSAANQGVEGNKHRYQNDARNCQMISSTTITSTA